MNIQLSALLHIMNMIRVLKNTFSIINQAKLINPYTHEPLHVHPYLTQSQLYQKVTEASSAQRKWKSIQLQTRISTVTKYVQSILSDQQQLKSTIAQSTGKSFKHISQQFSRLRLVVNPLIQNAYEILNQNTITDHKLKKKIVQEPLGLALIFPYFSEPIFDSLIHLVPCLISGNGALIKPSDYNYFLGSYLRTKANNLLNIEGLVNDIYIQPQQLKDIRQFRSIKKLIYSGSHTNAKHIFQVLVKNRFIDCNLFFGGQDAAYVDQTADLSLAAKEICKYAFYNCGQSYDCIKRLYLHHSVEEQFILLLTEEISKITIGNPTDLNTDLGPLTIPENTMHFESMISDAINDDSRCVIGGLVTTDGNTNGLFCEPTLLRNCSSDMQIIQKQLNAPILCCIRVDDEKDFVNEANETSFGTGIRIFSREPERYKRELGKMEVGYINFNGGSITNANLPIEGWKESGKGKILSQLSYEEYSIPKSYIIHH